MIIGIGIDIVEVDRFKNKASDKSFMDKLFSEREQAMFQVRQNKAEVIAGNFAAKEAAMKAFGVGFSSGYYREIEVLRKREGKPYILLSGKAKQAFDDVGGNHIFISISNLTDIACAQVILEK